MQDQLIKLFRLFKLKNFAFSLQFFRGKKVINGELC